MDKQKQYEVFKSYGDLIKSNIGSDFLKTIYLQVFTDTLLFFKCCQNKIDTLFDLLELDICNYYELFNEVDRGCDKVNIILKRISNKFLHEDPAFVSSRFYIFDIYFILYESDDKFLDFGLDMLLFDNKRLYNSLVKKNHIITWRDLYNFNCRKLSEIKYLGYKSIKDLYMITLDAAYSYKSQLLNFTDTSPKNKLDVFITRLKEFISKDEIFSPTISVSSYESIQKNLNNYILDFVKDTCSIVEFDIFKMYYDLYSKNTFNEIGNYYNLSRQRVHQIVNKIAKNVIFSFCNESICSINTSIDCFYDTLISLDKDVVGYILYSKKFSRFVYDIIHKLLEKYAIEEKYLLALAPVDLCSEIEKNDIPNNTQKGANKKEPIDNSFSSQSRLSNFDIIVLNSIIDCFNSNGTVTWHDLFYYIKLKMLNNDSDVNVTQKEFNYRHLNKSLAVLIKSGLVNKSSNMLGNRIYIPNHDQIKKVSSLKIS